MLTKPSLNSLEKTTRKSIFPSFLSVTVALLCLFAQEADCQTPIEPVFRMGEALQPDEKKSSVGSWGHLEFYQLILEPSDYLLTFSSDFNKWKEGTVWKFSSLNREGIEVILDNAGIDPSLREILVSEQHLTHNPVSDLYEIRPPESVIIALTSENRKLLYPRILPHNDQNPFLSPYALPVGGLGAVIYTPTGVPQKQLDLIQQLSYKMGNTTKFADINLVLAKAQDDTERWRILKTIRRERSLSVNLRITQQSNLLHLANYWDASGKNREVLPILESVVKTSGIETLDIVHLLPPTPRKLLHTYPSPDGYGLAKEMPDCYWTAASFFSEVPPDRYLDSIDQVIENRYEKAAPPLQLGDLIFMNDKKSGKAIHACNYIAANLVYTKNGKSLGRPWIISTLEDVVSEYLSVEEMSIVFMRLRPQYKQ